MNSNDVFDLLKDLLEKDYKCLSDKTKLAFYMHFNSSVDIKIKIFEQGKLIQFISQIDKDIVQSEQSRILRIINKENSTFKFIKWFIREDKNKIYGMIDLPFISRYSIDSSLLERLIRSLVASNERIKNDIEKE